MRDVLREVSREEMDEAVELLRSAALIARVIRLYGDEAKAISAYIDLLERRIQELGGEP